jgi:hypothetical protein
MGPVRFALLAVPALVLGGCHGSSQPPAFTISKAQIADRSAQAAVVTFELVGDNPNRDPIRLTDVTYAVSLAGAPAFAGTRRAVTTLRAFGQNAIVLPAPALTPNAAGIADGTPYTIRGTVGYIPPGTIPQTLYDAGIARPTVAFEQSGVISSAVTP